MSEIKMDSEDQESALIEEDYYACLNVPKNVSTYCKNK